MFAALCGFVILGSAVALVVHLFRQANRNVTKWQTEKRELRERQLRELRDKQG